MTYEWDIDNWIKTMIPSAIRKSRLVDFLLVLKRPLNTIFIEFKSIRLLLKKKMRFNGQVIVLENLLNDEFDELLRRIRIITITDTLRKKYIAQPSENKPLWIAQPSENNPQWIGLLIEYMNLSGYDFMVEVPLDVYSIEQLVQIKKITAMYKLAGKRAKYIYQNGQEF